VLGALAQDIDAGQNPDQLSQSHFHVEGSYGEICSNVYAAFRDYCRDQYANDGYEWATWRNQILSILPDHIIIYRWRDEVCDYFKLSYSVDGTGKVTFSEPEEVDVTVVVRALKNDVDDDSTSQSKEKPMNTDETQKQDAVADATVVETSKAVGHSDDNPSVGSTPTDANGPGASVPAPNDAATAATGVEHAGDEGVGSAASTGSTGAVATELAHSEEGLKGENPASPGKNVNVKQQSEDLVGKAEFFLQHVGVDKAKTSFCSILEQSYVEQGNQKMLRIQGIATRAEIESAAGIVYPLEVWEQNLEPMNTSAAAGKFIGKLEHPDQEQGLIDTAIRFDKFWIQGNDVHFSGVVLNTENGRELQALIEGGVQIDMSSRGYGKAQKQSWRGKEVLVIQSGFVCTGFDAVHYGASTGSAITEAQRQSKNQPKEGETTVEETTTQTAAQTQDANKPTTQSKADQLREAAIIQSTRASLLDVSNLNAIGQKAYEKALAECQTLEALIEKSEGILPTLQSTFAKPNDDEAQEQGGTAYAPYFFTKQSKEETAPQTPGELIERLVADLPDTPYGTATQGAFPDNHFRSPRAACRRLLQNIARERTAVFDGHKAVLGLLALEQGKVERAGDILTQSLATGSTVAGGNAEGDGAPLSAPLIFPLVRRIFPRYIMNEIASIQPMDRPEGKIFFLDQWRVGDPSGSTEKRIDLNTSSNPFNSSFADNATEGAQAKLVRLRLTSQSVSAHTKKLGAQWSIEEMQDLRAYHGLDAAQELMSGVAREVALEWNLEVLNDMLAQASAGSLTFGTTTPASGFPNQVDWDAYIWVYIQKLDNLIFSKRNGPMTHIVCGVDAALALAKSGRMTFTIGGENGGDMDEIYPGAVYMGVVNAPNGSKYKVLKTNFWGSGTTEGSKILGLRRGSEWSDTPYIWAPYTDYVTPMLTDPDDFSQKQGIMSRAAKKVVVGDAMGVITVSNATGVVL